MKFYDNSGRTSDNAESRALSIVHVAREQMTLVMKISFIF